MSLPPTPPWSGFHVLLVHFPIALLLVAPILMLLAILLQKKLPGVSFTAWVVLLLGTIAIWVAMKSGQAAWEEAALDNADGQALLTKHKDMGETVPWFFSGLFLAYSLVLLLPLVIKRLKAVTFRTVGTLVILAAYPFAAIYLANTAHAGGLLVHFYGVRADTAESVAAKKAADDKQAADDAAAAKAAAQSQPEPESTRSGK